MRPEVGDVLAYEVSEGRAVLLRVVAQVDDACCVVLSRWQGKPPKKVPTAKALFEVQPLKHHQWDRPMIGGWVREPLPPEVRVVGRVAVKRPERARVMHPRDFVNAVKKTTAMGQRVLPMASWFGVLRDAKAQWRWDHERDEVLAEEKAAQDVKLEAYEAAVEQLKAEKLRQATRSFDEWKSQRFFETWSHAPAALVTQLEAAMQATVTQLEREADPLPALRELMKKFNVLNGAAGHEFDGADGEELAQAAELLAQAAGLDAERFEDDVLSLRSF